MIVEAAETPKHSEAEATFLRRYGTVVQILRSTIDQKDPAEISVITSIARKFGSGLTESQFALAVGENEFGKRLLQQYRQREAKTPAPTNEEELALLILFALLSFRNGRWAVAQAIFSRILFEAPHEFYQRDYLEVLSNYLFYKYLLCIEREGRFAAEKDALFVLLKKLQLVHADALYSTLLVFVARSLLRQRQFGPVALLLRHAEFPRKTTAANHSKFLFYKGLFASLGGRFAEARALHEEALLKAPEGVMARYESAGYKNFKLLVTKHLIVLNLMLSQPSHHTLFHGPHLKIYKRLVKLVTKGLNRDFEELIARQHELFRKDLVLHVLQKMKAVVIQNALKKVSTAYTSISVAEVLRKLGAEREPGFDLAAFVSKSRDVIESFAFDPVKEIITFEKNHEHYGDAAVRKSLLDRVRHLQMLEEQILRSLKYPPKKVELIEKAELEAKPDDNDLDAIDFDDLDLDD